ncbi:inositol monophosphatase family protein [Wenxinia marina]|uniref:Archaeal fructose-1,6-bisphosphatase n=1 Tax=Wenxinia marina DSM 24838 TaxID=1123501 RepID=A0A0D0Q143_9RHOB|nr:inositol monophosphatase [Wenxinia marina]KIQ68274.1 Archaeal fructose-1,6-bisphosphatase [Wenxinia marina DSM 24838]GGL79335.1 inositol phosphatase [Wenxinia marina]
MTPLERAHLVAAVRKAAADQVLPRFRRLDEGEVQTKTGPADLVTVADTEAEAALTGAVRSLWPDALVVGEEATEERPDLPEGLADAARAVVIDPVDGTWNFRAGIAAFGMILAVTEGGRTVWGLLHDPVCDDGIEAAEDGPAELIRSDASRVTLATSRENRPERMTGFVPLGLAPAALRPALAATMPRFARATSLRCSAHEYRVIASGHAEFALSLQLKPWDHLAGALIVRRAGGVARTLDGMEYGPGVTEGPLLVAGSEEAWHAAAEIFRPVFRPA